MTEMPKRLRVGPLVYSVQHSHEATMAFSKVAGEDIYGACQNRICNIIIDEGFPLDREQKTLLHEAVHALQCVYDLSDDLKAGDEHYIRVFSAALLDTLRRNPELVRYLMEEKGEGQGNG